MTMGWLADESGLQKCAANYAPLTPLSHLQRAADVFADRTAVVWKSTRLTYAEYHARVSQLASALAETGIAPGDVVATLLPTSRRRPRRISACPPAGRYCVPSTLGWRRPRSPIRLIIPAQSWFWWIQP